MLQQTCRIMHLLTMSSVEDMIMIKPGEIQEYEINKEFTDRDEARSLFWEWYEKVNKNLDDFFKLHWCLLNFTGISVCIYCSKEKYIIEYAKMSKHKR